MESLIIKFLKFEVTDNKGRDLSTYCNFTKEELETNHDYIQWMFPTDVLSQHNKNAPILTLEDIEIIKKDEFIKQNIMASYLVFMDFISNTDHWLTPLNHNFLRFSRIARCLYIVGINNSYKEFQKFLDIVYNSNKEIIGEQTYNYWKKSNSEEFINIQKQKAEREFFGPCEIVKA